MSRKYHVCTKLVINEKASWPKIGMTLTVKDDGTIFLYDARTGQSYYCFEREQKERNQGRQGGDVFDRGGDDLPPF